MSTDRYIFPLQSKVRSGMMAAGKGFMIFDLASYSDAQAVKTFMDTNMANEAKAGINQSTHWFIPGIVS